jgi:hypothetical protein
MDSQSENPGLKTDQELQGGSPTDASHNLAASPIAAEDTGVSREIQADPAFKAATPPTASEPSQSPEWSTELRRFYNDMNGLLAQKENLKLTGMDIGAKPSFMRQWSRDANAALRVTAVLRRRLAKI